MTLSDSCLLNYNSNVLTYYSPRLLPTQRTEQNLIMGVELEVRHNSRASFHAGHKISEWMPDFAICKSDSSTGEHGFEICTVPATLEVHKEVWPTFFNNCASHCIVDYPHSSGGSLGLHVHMDRTYLTPLTLGKLLIFYNADKNFEFIKNIAGRGPTDYQRRNSELKMHSVITKGSDPVGSKYSIVNTGKRKSIEIRCFHSTTDLALFMARLEFVEAVAEFCKATSIKKLEFTYFNKWIQNSKQRQNRYSYLYNLNIAGEPSCA